MHARSTASASPSVIGRWSVSGGSCPRIRRMANRIRKKICQSKGDMVCLQSGFDWARSLGGGTLPLLKVAAQGPGLEYEACRVYQNRRTERQGVVGGQVNKSCIITRRFYGCGITPLTSDKWGVRVGCPWRGQKGIVGAMMMKWVTVDAAAEWLGKSRDQVLDLAERCEFDTLIDDSGLLIEMGSLKDFRKYGPTPEPRRFKRRRGERSS